MTPTLPVAGTALDQRWQAYVLYEPMTMRRIGDTARILQCGHYVTPSGVPFDVDPDLPQTSFNLVRMDVVYRQ